MLKVGITGNIGGGKTTVCRIFETLRVPVFNADEAALKLYDDGKIKQQVKEIFGETIYRNGTLDRKKLAAITFSDKNLLQRLNHIIHPATIKLFDQWAEEQDSPYVLKEAAILFEAGADKGCDKIITVFAPEALRVERVLQRNAGWTKEDVLKRQQNQWSDEEKIKRSDYVIYNDGREFLIKQVMKIHSLIRQFDNSLSDGQAGTM
jgi:dephospho-CoA kinase